MSWLLSGYAAFFLLLGGYVARLVLMGWRLARERERLTRARRPSDPRVH